MQGIAPITLETAVALDRITGVPASVWNRREADYREALLRSKLRVLTEDDKAWLDSLPINELKKNGLPDEKDKGRLFDAVLSFFGVADRDAYDRVWKVPVASFRRSGAYKRSGIGRVVATHSAARSTGRKGRALFGLIVPQGSQADPLA